MKKANSAVLCETNMPAVLIEYAFISNSNDKNSLINEVEKLAELTANGIVNYVGGSKIMEMKPAMPSKKKVDEMAQSLSSTAKKDMCNLLQHAYDTKVFSVNYTSKVDSMTRGQALDLLISYTARTLKY